MVVRVDYRLLPALGCPLPALSLDTDGVGGCLEQQNLSFEQGEDNSQHHSAHSSAQLLMAQDSRESPQGPLDLKSE